MFISPAFGLAAHRMFIERVIRHLAPFQSFKGYASGVVNDAAFLGPDTNEDGMDEKQFPVTFVIFRLHIAFVQRVDIDAGIAGGLHSQ